MGLRSKLKSALKPMLGRLSGAGNEEVPEGQGPGQSPVPDPPPPKKTDSAYSAPPVAAKPPEPVAAKVAAPAAKVAAPAAKVAAPAAKVAAPAATESVAAEAGEDENEAEKLAKQLARQERHRHKTQRGVLKKLDELGGTAEMADMHDFSERRYFVAHRAFSRMMEFYLEDSLIRFDADTGVMEITETGRAYSLSEIPES